MSNETSRTISTAAIWLSVTVILTFGICKMNFEDPLRSLLISFLLPLLIVVAATVATWILWRPRSASPGSPAPTPGA